MATFIRKKCLTCGKVTSHINRVCCNKKHAEYTDLWNSLSLNQILQEGRQSSNILKEDCKVNEHSLNKEFNI